VCAIDFAFRSGSIFTPQEELRACSRAAPRVIGLAARRRRRERDRKSPRAATPLLAGGACLDAFATFAVVEGAKRVTAHSPTRAQAPRRPTSIGLDEMGSALSRRNRHQVRWLSGLGSRETIAAALFRPRDAIRVQSSSPILIHLASCSARRSCRLLTIALFRPLCSALAEPRR